MRRLLAGVLFALLLSNTNASAIDVLVQSLGNDFIVLWDCHCPEPNGCTGFCNSEPSCPCSECCVATDWRVVRHANLDVSGDYPCMILDNAFYGPGIPGECAQNCYAVLPNDNIPAGSVQWIEVIACNADLSCIEPQCVMPYSNVCSE